ncbi:little elongation complex subunit 2 [Macrobrachium rosenbergii]|uniref:little elongation complex subunit 2 n=1 Tax=Macrobrachium rosenbergii TaxID=79674 RepID=UPI0034D4F9F4
MPRARGQSKAYILYAKPEFQVYFGCEVNTLSEITQQWLDLLVRPNTTLLEVRVCQTTGDIMLSEEKTLATVLKEGKQQHINFSPQQPLATMYAVFNAVNALPTGDYILHHDVKTEAFIKLLKAIDVGKEMSVQNFDFHAAYSSASVYTRTHAKPPWIALDTHKLTAFHLKHYKIPGTFPMDNPSKKLTKSEKKKIKEKAQHKKRLEEIEANEAE